MGWIMTDLHPLLRTKQWKTMLDWFQTGRERFLVLQGEPGNGKTQLARHLFDEYAGGKGQFHTFAKLVETHSGSPFDITRVRPYKEIRKVSDRGRYFDGYDAQGKAILYNLRRLRLVVIDDLDSEVMGNYGVRPPQVAYHVINTIYSTPWARAVVSTNMTKPQIRALDPHGRVYSRLKDSRVVVFDGGDARGTRADAGPIADWKIKQAGEAS